MRPVIKNAVTALAFLAFCALVGLTVGCPIKAATGLPCPGCGLTRGCMALLRLDFAGAFHWHPLSFLVPIIFFVYIFKDNRQTQRLFDKTPVMVTAVLVLLGVYIWRMKMFFPHTPPMDFQVNSLFGKFVHLLLQ